MASQSIVASVRVLLLLMATGALAGCGAAAAPCRVASAGLKILPAIGHTLAEPTDSCASAIDPNPAPEQ